MELKSAIERLANAAHQGTGGSAGAATVLLFGWNSVHPIRGLLSLDDNNRFAALTVIMTVLDGVNCERHIENVVGYHGIQALVEKYGVHGSAWAA